MPYEKLIFVVLALVGSTALIPSAQAAFGEHYGKTISYLYVADSPCIFFQLTDVTQANPNITPGEWFAIDKNQGNAKEMYAVLLTARTTGAPLRRVTTDGNVVCGVAKVRSGFANLNSQARVAK